MYNTSRMVVFVRVLAEGVKGAFLNECEAAFLSFPLHVFNKIWQRGRYGSGGYCCKKDLNTTNYIGALGSTTPAHWLHFFSFWARRGGGVLEGV